MFGKASSGHATGVGRHPGIALSIAASMAGALLLLSGTASAAVLYVCHDGGPYTTIQSAVNASGPGDTIIVCPGTYTEDVVISGNRNYLSILSTEIAQRGPNTTLDGGFVIAFAPNFGPDYVTIKGFTIVGGASDNGVCISSAGDYTTIAFNRAVNCQGPFAGGDGGIRLNKGTFDSTVHHNEIVCDESAPSGFGINAEADVALGGGGHTIHHNSVSGCTKGILVSASNNVIGHNEIENGPQQEIDISGSSNQVLHNTVCGDIRIGSQARSNHLVQNRYTGSLTNNGGNTNKLTKNQKIDDCPF
jgi:hypothetical protein